MAAAAAVTVASAFRARLTSIMETSFPNGVKDDNFLDFDDKFLELLSQTLVTENGQYGALQYVVSDALWNTLSPATP